MENEGDTWFINTYFDTEISSKTYKGIYNHLKQYEKELKNRQDKGKTHFNLRAYDYYDKFSQPKIIYIYTALEHYFYFDTSGLYFNNSSYMISNGDLFLSCWLNSPIFNFYKKQKFVAYGNATDGGRNKLDYNKMVNFPIPIVSESTKKEFEEIAVKLQTVSQELYKKSAQFISLFMADVAKPQLSVTDAIASSDGISRVVYPKDLETGIYMILIGFCPYPKKKKLHFLSSKKPNCKAILPMNSNFVSN